MKKERSVHHTTEWLSTSTDHASKRAAIVLISLFLLSCIFFFLLITLTAATF